MILIVRDSHELGPCFQNCFGPVTKIKVYNYMSHGYLHINGTAVVATGDVDGSIYKISAGRSFYLYDMKAEKFICWKRPHRTKGLPNKKPLVARKFSNVNCQFNDVAVPEAGGYVNLVPAANHNLKMKFNRNGKFASQDCLHRVRHRHRCSEEAWFLIQVYQDSRYPDHDERACKCPEARRHFCRSKFTKMKVFEKICSLSNETYDF